MTERYGWDQTPTPDLGLDITKAPADIQKLYKWIIEKMYGEDVASAYGQAMVLTGILAKNAEAMSLFTSGRMDDLTSYVNDILVEMTGKDIISAPEIIQARDGELTLSERLDRDFGAVLLKEPYVTYKQFGAIMDGVNDDTASVIAAHNYANSRNLPVVNRSGDIVLTDRVIVKTPTDLRGSKLILKDVSDRKSLFRIEGYKSPIVVTEYDQSELVKGTLRIPSLNAYRNHLIVITSNEHFTNRYDGGNITAIKKADSFYITKKGVLTSGVLNHDFTSGTLVVTAYPLETELDFYSPEIVWDFSTSSGRAVAISVARSNTNLINTHLKILTDISVDDGAYKEQLIEISRAYDIKILGFSGENITEGVSSSGYIFNMSHCQKVLMEDVTALSGWGVTGTNYIREWIIRDSEINRIDVHTGAGDINCDNVDFIGRYGVYVGSGMGTISINNCRWLRINSDGREGNNLILLAMGYGQLFGGDIYINNCEVDFRDGSSGSKLVGVYNSYGPTSDSASNYDFMWPSLKVKGLVMKSSSPSILLGYDTTYANGMYPDLIRNNRMIVPPKFIIFEDITVIEPSDTNRFQGVVYRTQFEGTSPVPNANIKLVETIIRLKDIRQPVSNKYISGYDSTSDKNPSPMVTIYAGSTARIYLTLVRVSGGLAVISSSKSIEVYDSNIALIDTSVASNAGPDIVRIFGSRIYLTPSASGTNSVLYSDNLEIYNSVIFPAIHEGASRPLVEFTRGSRGVRRLHGNVFSSTFPGITQELIDRYDNFKLSGLYH